MQKIDLNHDWYGSNQDTENFDDIDWQPVSLENLPSDIVWLRQTFEMLPNESCATWWLEFDEEIDGEIWVNEQALGEIEPQLNITNSHCDR